MRLTDLEEWIEQQFLDTNPAKVKEPEPQPEPEPEPISVAPGDRRAERVPSPTQGVSVQFGGRVPVQPQLPVPPPDDVTIPSIEQYLPFLKATDGLGEAEEPTDRAPDALAQASRLPVEPEPPAVPPVAQASRLPVESEASTAAPVAQASRLPVAPAPPAAPPGTRPSRLPVEPEASASPPVAQASRLPRTGSMQPATEPQVDRREESADTERLPGRSRRGRGRSRARSVSPPELAPPLTGEQFWQLAPRHVRTLIAMGQDDVVQGSYKRQFKESRLALIERLLDPTLSLEDTARLLNVCPTTVRRYTNRGLLRHQRTAGDQRRFKLSDVLGFMEAQSSAGGDGS